MADVNIDSTISSDAARGRPAMVWVTDQIGYQFYIAGGGFYYAKTTDGGATWADSNQVNAVTSGFIYAVWFDGWNQGDTGTLIHCAWCDTGNDDVQYRSLDTNGDTLGTTTVVFAGATAVAGRGTFVSITKALDGKLYVAYDIDAGAEKGFHRSTDGGGTWSASLSATFVEATLDELILFPAYNTGDQADVLAIYMDASASALTLKMWDSSAATAGESATIIAQTQFATDTSGQGAFSGTVRWSDGHILMEACTERDTATADHVVYDLNCTGSASFTLTAKGNITTNIDDHYYGSIFIDQGTGDLYVAYTGKRDGSENMGSAVKVYYTVSTNGGTSWTAGDTAYMEGAAAGVFQTWTALMGPRFYVAWRAGSALVGNAVNSLTFATGESGAGSITIAGLSLTGAGKAGIKSTSGAITPAGLSSSGSGKTGIIGSGSIQIAGLSSSGAGGPVYTGSGAITVGGLGSSGTGDAAVPPSGAGAITTSGLSVAGQGKTGIIGQGSLGIGGVGSAGAGAIVYSGAGAVTVGGLGSVGAGKVGSIGSGALGIAGLALSGTGTVTGGPIAGSGSIGIGGLSMSGTGTVTPPAAVTPIDPWFPGRGEVSFDRPGERKKKRHRHPLRVPRALRPVIVEVPLPFPPPLTVPLVPEPPAIAPTLPRSPFDLPQGQPGPFPEPAAPAPLASAVSPEEPAGAHWSEYAHQPYTCRDEIEDMELILAAVVRALRD